MEFIQILGTEIIFTKKGNIYMRGKIIADFLG